MKEALKCWLVTCCALLSLAGCTFDRAGSDAAEVLPDIRAVALVNANGTNTASLLISNTLPNAISFYEIDEEQQICSIQTLHNNELYDLNDISYCLTGRDRVLLSPGESKVMNLPIPRLSLPWRIVMDFKDMRGGATRTVSTPFYQGGSVDALAPQPVGFTRAVLDRTGRGIRQKSFCTNTPASGSSLLPAE